MVKPRLEGNLPDLRPLSRTKLQSAWLPPQQEGAQTIRRVLSVSRLSKDPVVLDRGMAEGLASRLQNPCDPHVAAHTLHRTLPSIHRRTTAYRPELDSRDQTRRLSADGPPQRGRRLPAHPQRPRLGDSLPALIVQVVGALRLRSCLIDGEAVCCDGQGCRSSTSCGSGKSTHSLDRVRHTGYLMSRKVVHDDDVTAVERWSQTLFDVGEEDCPVHRPIDHEGCDHPVVAQSDNRVMVFQWPWGTDPTNRSPRGQRPRSLTKLVLVAVSSINTNLAGSSRPCLRSNAAAPAPRLPVLARSRAGFFLTVTLCRSKKRQTAVRLPEFAACASPQRSHPRSDPVARLPEPTAIPPAPPTACTSLRNVVDHSVHCTF